MELKQTQAEPSTVVVGVLIVPFMELKRIRQGGHGLAHTVLIVPFMELKLRPEPCSCRRAES